MKNERGQMAVELCVTMPIALAVAVVILDTLTFAAACAEFDHLAPQAIVALAAVPEGVEFDAESCCAQIKERLEQELDSSHLEVTVNVGQDGSIRNFTCAARAAPWPFSASGSFFGLHVPSLLSHETELAVRPYSMGDLL